MYKHSVQYVIKLRVREVHFLIFRGSKSYMSTGFNWLHQLRHLVWYGASEEIVC
jgi:hypothetical protein